MSNTAKGAEDDPWQLATPPGTSAFQMWTDDAADPPALVCQVGRTQLRYARPPEQLDARAVTRCQGDLP